MSEGEGFAVAFINGERVTKAAILCVLHSPQLIRVCHRSDAFLKCSSLYEIHEDKRNSF